MVGAVEFIGITSGLPVRTKPPGGFVQVGFSPALDRSLLARLSGRIRTTGIIPRTRHLLAGKIVVKKARREWLCGLYRGRGR